MYVFIQPLHHGQDGTQGQLLSGVRLITKVKQHSLLYYLPIAEGGIDGFISFLVGEINIKWNANSLVKVLNPGHWLYFLSW